MQTMDEALNWIYAIRKAPWRHKLDRMHRLAELMGTPNGGNRPFIHIAGTNGKGSTVTFAESMLRHAGFTTCHCVSPYVYSVRERIAANGEPVTEQEFTALAEQAKAANSQLESEDLGPATIFEIFTAMAFRHWHNMQAEFGVVEVGLGGTLDCTNIIDPAVSAIVSVGWDHTDILGETLPKIAAEKAGVIKPGRPVVIGDMPQEARAVLLEKAEQQGAPAHLYSRDWSVSADKDDAVFTLQSAFGTHILPKPRRLPGPVQIHNAGVAALCFLAATANKLDPGQQQAAMELAMQNAFLPGRFEVVRHHNRTWVLDGAHNEQSAAELVRTFRRQYPGIKPAIVFGMLNRHDPRPVADLLTLLGGDIHCVPINWETSQNPQELAQTCGIPHWHPSLQNALESIQAHVVVVTGSFYLLSDFRQLMENGSQPGGEHPAPRGR